MWRAHAVMLRRQISLQLLVAEVVHCGRQLLSLVAVQTLSSVACCEITLETNPHRQPWQIDACAASSRPAHGDPLRPHALDDLKPSPITKTCCTSRLASRMRQPWLVLCSPRHCTRRCHAASTMFARLVHNSLPSAPTPNRPSTNQTNRH